MRPVANVLLSVAILSTIQLGRATPVDDPQIKVGDPANATPLFSPVWSFKSDATGGGTFAFINDTGNVWRTLDFFVTLPSTDTITCTSTIFVSCDYTSNPAGGGLALFDIGFETPANGVGIEPKGTFSIDLNTAVPTISPSIDPGGWGAYNSFEGIANVPEPASWTLMAAGLLFCAFGAIYRRAT